MGKNLGIRHILALVMMCSTLMSYFTRLTLSTAILAMLDEKITEKLANGTIVTIKRFEWSEKAQGIILGSFFYGYLAFQIVYGRLAETIGPRILISFSMIGTAVLNFLTPWIVNYYNWFIASRVLMGALQAGVYSSAFMLATKWIPDSERSTFISMAYIGGNFGTILISSISGYLCEYGFAGGWPSVFYVTGILLSIFSILYYCLVTNDPSEHWLIKKKELNYIKANLKQTPISSRKKVTVPWLKILKSPPIWAGMISQFSSMWALNIFLLKLPNYIKNVLKIPIEQTGYTVSMFYMVENIRYNNPCDLISDLI